MAAEDSGVAREARADAADHPPGFGDYAAERPRGVDAGAPGKDGELRLRFERAAAGDRTRLASDYARAPYHLTGGLTHDEPFASVRVQSPTAGVGQGDRLRMDLAAGPDARASVTGASATKVFGMDRNYGRATVEARAEAGAYLELLPEPTIVFGGARFHQRVDLRAAADAAVVYADTFVPGRLARGEAFAFDRYASVVAGHTPDGLGFRDATDLGSDAGLVTSPVEAAGPGVMGDHGVVGSLYALAPDADAGALAERLHERLADHIAPGPADEDAETEAEADDAPSADPTVETSATRLPGDCGAVARALGPDARAVTDALAAARDAVRRDLTGHPAPERRRW
jgi:urease accessory protein